MMELFPNNLKRLNIIFLKKLSCANIIAVEVVLHYIVDSGVALLIHK